MYTFRKNAFEHVHKFDRGIYAFQEAKELIIRDQIWNRSWVQCLYGNIGLERIGHLTPVCSGTTITSVEYAITYTKYMSDIMESKSSICQARGIDQGGHNWLIYTDIFQTEEDIPVHIILNEYGWVASWASMDFDKYLNFFLEI
eukprot:UN28264